MALVQPNIDTQHSLINEHVPLALQLARRMAYRLPWSVSREDVEGAALLGLAEAASRYDSMRAEPFMAFASQRIRGAILDHLRRIDHLSRRSRQDARRVSEARRRKEVERGVASEAEIAAELGVSIEKVRASHVARRSDHRVDLDTALEGCLGRETPMECVERQQLRTALAEALRTLDRRSLVILALYYQEGLTLREIGEVLEVTESRVSQLHSQILRTLRAMLA